MLGIDGKCFVTFDSDFKLLDFVFRTSMRQRDELRANVMKQYGAFTSVKEEKSPVKYVLHKWTSPEAEYALLESEYLPCFYGVSSKVKRDTTVPMFPPKVLPRIDTIETPKSFH